MAGKSHKEEQNESFEEILENLEQIVEKIENGGLGLEESIRLYEEGMKKAEKLEIMLAETRERVLKLMDTSNAKPSLEPFEGEEKV